MTANPSPNFNVCKNRKDNETAWYTCLLRWWPLCKGCTFTLIRVSWRISNLDWLLLYYVQKCILSNKSFTSSIPRSPNPFPSMELVTYEYTEKKIDTNLLQANSWTLCLWFLRSSSQRKGRLNRNNSIKILLKVPLIEAIYIYIYT